MRVSQSIPTDSLYKFMAVVGIILTLSVSFSLLYFNYLSYNLSKANKHTWSYQRSKNLLDRIECRRHEIIYEARNSDKCVINGVEPTRNQDELDGLAFIESVQRQDIAVYETFEQRARPLIEHIEFVTKYNLHLIFSVIAGLSFSLMLIGMKRWYEKVQKPINKMTILDLEIREIEKNKVSAELAKIKLETVKIEKELEEMNSKKHMPFKTRKEL
ncbi:hypothetical protein ACYVL9_000349 [Vibrio fluvialis]|uniref:hypothetical protein n=1 Tax=Vibrio fluvialis TaxID=676 RepID=UPI001C9C034B|nr:hypothetical protein [Vibrio fluvialis]